VHCDYKASRKDTLLKHIQSKHEGVKFSCDQCAFKATLKGTLLTHVKSKHEGVKYPCNQCDYEASRKSSLKNHLKSKHEGVKHPSNDLLKWHLTEENDDQNEDKEMKQHHNVPKEKKKRTCSEELVIQVIEEVNEKNFDQAFENCFALILRGSKRKADSESNRLVKKPKESHHKDNIE